MALSIKDPETDRLARALAKATGESLTDAIRRALEVEGPVVLDCIVDKNEPPLPGNIKFKQAVHFAEALAKGEKDSGKIIKTIIEDKIREVV